MEPKILYFEAENRLMDMDLFFELYAQEVDVKMFALSIRCLGVGKRIRLFFKGIPGTYIMRVK